MERILIIEDEEKIMKVLSDFLKVEGYEVIKARDGISGLSTALNKNPDLILLDIMLPKKSGYDVCKELKAQGNLTPIIMLTAKGEELDKVLGLELGADDYVTKPFGLKELNARIRALLRRIREPTDKKKIDNYEFGNIKVDFKRHEIIKKGKKIPLSSMESNLLKFFVMHRGEVINRDTLLDEVWGYKDAAEIEGYPTTRTIDTHILNLRKKIEDNPNNPKYLLTIHRAGYKFTG